MMITMTETKAKQTAVPENHIIRKITKRNRKIIKKNFVRAGSSGNSNIPKVF